MAPEHPVKGAGGVEVEGRRDVAFALAPLTRDEAEQLVDATWAGRKLRGFRNVPAADRAAVLEAILRIGRLAGTFPQIAEVEINPLRVMENGVVGVDVRVRVSDDG